MFILLAISIDARSALDASLVEERQSPARPRVLQGQAAPALAGKDLDRGKRKAMCRDCRIKPLGEGQRDACRRHQPPLGLYPLDLWSLG